MSNIVTIGYSTEGATDERFLKAIIEKTFAEIAFECKSMIEVFEPVHIRLINNKGFVEGVKSAAREAFQKGVLVLCIHVDADSPDDHHVFRNKIVPAFEAIEKANENTCDNLVAVIPVQMSEAWMLADKALLKSEIGTDLSDEDLGINVFPEAVSDPKAVLINALRVAQDNLPKRRKRITISDLYQPVGQGLTLEELVKLKSFRKFKKAVRSAFVKLSYF